MVIKKYSIKEIDIKQKIFIDCKNAIYGRLLSLVAKLSTIELVKKIYLLNLQNILLKSKPNVIVKDYKERINKGVGYGPFFPKSKERFIKYIIKSMYPKTKKGMSDYKKVITWIIPKIENELAENRKAVKQKLFHMK